MRSETGSVAADV